MHQGLHPQLLDRAVDPGALQLLLGLVHLLHEGGDLGIGGVPSELDPHCGNGPLGLDVAGDRPLHLEPVP